MAVMQQNGCKLPLNTTEEEEEEEEEEEGAEPRLSDATVCTDDLCGGRWAQSVGEEPHGVLPQSGSLEAAMASGLFGVVVVLALTVALAPCVSGSSNCLASYNQPYKSCSGIEFCCGSCMRRYCCTNIFDEFSEDVQEDCDDLLSHHSSPLSMILGIGSVVTVFLIFICCCVCPCCCLYKMCRKPRPVIATSTHTTVITNTPQQYPQQPTATPGQPQSYQGGQYQMYHPVPVQPGYGAQPGPQAYGAQPGPQAYGPQPGPQAYGPQPGPQAYGPQPGPQAYGPQPMPTPPYHGQAIAAGPPPTYQEASPVFFLSAAGPGFPPQPMPYSQAAFSPGQPAYPLQPPVQPQPKAPNPQSNYLAQPAYNPDYTG
ncbi:protein shisa-5-like isoform X2 [Cebidichthys violaceus]|uniref:protein shisa-5-like isoform X2 n=1 Tax=Cebidichthys violaceus TaxID=271503 RepID=UPI0035CB8E0C